MAKLNWNPWMGLDENGDDTERGFEEISVNTDSANVWSPAADMVESERHIHILVEVPGLSLEDMVVEVQQGELVVCGRRCFARDDRDNLYHVLERDYGPFLRRFSLPKRVNSRSVSARLSNGLLTITIAKRPPGRRTIKVG
ncbi:Hsp20/alpha crystallin family protein [Desulfovibrio oxyclinae]|uniref:Hsp20/alpha crystallin family protein n=1 Tax=Desulfovibrio oxyclinae TaxID=63560 RepID=UPI0004767023|nr:Hsp20/alpha crystallin family protein [Desulfovibrio oxyclinae]